MSVADEAEAAVAVYASSARATVAGVRGAKKVHRAAQNVGMRYQNWRHKGAGEEADGVAPAAAVNGIDAVKNRTDRPWGKNWTTDEESLENTTTSHTTYTRKRTR